MLSTSVALKPAKLRFVSHFRGAEESTRTRELELAQRRSHAARAAHKKRRTLQQAQYASLVAPPRPWRGNSDPFLALPVTISAQDYDRMQAYRSIMFHIIWPSRGNVIMSPIFHDWNATVSTCLSDASSAEALVALCLMWVKPRYSDTTYQDSCTKELLRHRADSLTAVRARLETFSQPWRPPLTLIMAIIFLTVGLAVAGDNAEASIHLKGLQQLVKAYGGFHNLPYFARGSIMGVDHAVSVAIMSPLVFSSTLYDPAPLVLSQEEHQAYDDFFHSQPPLPDSVPDQLRSFFLFHRDMVAVLDIALNCYEPVRRTELLQWVLLRRYVPQSETQDNCCALKARKVVAAQDPAAFASLALEASVRVAAQYMFRLIYFPRPGQSAIFADFNVIQESLAIEEVRALIPPDLLLWLTAVSACIERALRLTRHRPWWHAPRFLLLAQSRGLTTADDVARVASQLVWYDIPLKDHVEALFEQQDAIYDETDYVLNKNYQRVAMDGALTISWSNVATKL